MSRFGNIVLLAAVAILFASEDPEFERMMLQRDPDYAQAEQRAREASQRRQAQQREEQRLEQQRERDRWEERRRDDRRYEDRYWEDRR